MKSNLVLLVTMALMSTAAFAQNSSTETMTTSQNLYNNYSSEGIRVSLIKSTFDAGFKIENSAYASTSSGKSDYAYGVGIGYARLPIDWIGFTVNAAYFQAKANQESDSDVSPIYGFARVDGNLAWTFNQYLNIKGGLNLGKFVNGSDDLKKLSPGLGYQASLGIQMTKNWGLDLGYAESHVNGKLEVSGVDIGDVDVKLSGFEIGLNGTFR